MKRFCLQVLTCAALLCSALLHGGQVKDYIVYKLPAPPVMDGKIEDNVWKNIPEARGFYHIRTSELAMVKPTFFKLAWHGNTLYLALWAFEPEIARTSMHANSFDGMWSDDNIEVFIAKGLKAYPYHQLVINAAGNRWYWLVNQPKTKNTRLYDDFVVKGHKGKDYWVIEAAIPFRLFDVNKGYPEECRFNIGRDLQTGPRKESNTSWSKVLSVKGSYNVPERYNRLLFKNYQAPENRSRVQTLFNSDYNSFVWKRMRFISRNEGEIRSLALNNPDSPDLQELFRFQKFAAKEFARKTPDNSERFHKLHKDFLSLAAKVQTLVKKQVMTVQAKDAVCKLFLNGEEVPVKNGKATLLIQKEGLFNVAVQCRQTGKNPKVKLMLDGHDYTLTRWKAGAAKGKWKEFAFDDRKWMPVTCDKDGFFWNPGKEKDFVVRQNFCWASNNYSQFSRIPLLVKKWNFSEGGVDGVPTSISSPFTYPLSNYEYILEMPDTFEVMEMTSHSATCIWGGSRPDRYWSITSKPTSIRKEKIRRNGTNYIRWRLTFPEKDAQNRVRYTHVPVQYHGKGNAPDTKFYFRASGNGNYTELENSLSVGFLPPINGRQPKHFVLWGYDGLIGGHSFPASLVKALARDSVKAGFNYWMTHPTLRKKDNQVYHDAVRSQPGGGGKFVIWESVELGIRGAGWYKRNDPSAIRALLAKEPRYRAVFYKNSDTWKTYGRLCPVFAVGEGREALSDALVKEFNRLYFRHKPYYDIIWHDWEKNPWIQGIAWMKATTGNGSHCFCKLCKDEFRKYMKMAPGTDLPDEVIFKKYYYEWERFRIALDGKMFHMISHILRKRMGKQYWWYDFSLHRKYWEATKGCFDRIHPGLPGITDFTSQLQKGMDQEAAYFRNLGYKTLIGQRFIFMGPGSAVKKKDNVFPGRRLPVNSADGFIHPEAWKGQLLRVAATFKGGLDIDKLVHVVAGMRYYFGEAMRLIAEYEDVIVNGERKDNLAVSKEISYPDMLVVTRGKKRLVFLFNESAAPKKVTVKNLSLAKGQKARLYYAKKAVDPANAVVTINANDAEVICIE